MKRLLLMAVVLLLASLLAGQEFTPYMNIMHSSRCEDGNIRVRWSDFSSNMLQTEFLYSTGSGWQNAVVGNSGEFQMQALVPYNFGQTLRYRLRTEISYENQSYVYMHPAYLSADTFPPAVTNLGLIAADPVGDSVMVYAPMLDFTNSWCGATQSKIFSALSNVSNSFPTLNSLTSYNAYATTIANPASVADSLVYAMLYTFNVPGLISSGLYKMYMDDTGIPAYSRIGDIQSMVMGGKLYLACNISDLTSDPDFGAWPNDYNALGIASLSMRLTVNLSTEEVDFGFGDYSTPALLIFEDNLYQAAQNSLPEISSFSLTGSGTAMLNFTYTDANGDFPLDAYFQTDNGSMFALEPGSFDFSQPVTFTGTIPYLPVSGTLRVSDNQLDWVEYHWPPSAMDDPLPPARSLSCRLPNPLRSGDATLSVSLGGLEKGALSLTVYDLRGRKLGSIFAGSVTSPEQEIAWDGRVAGQTLPSGIYILNVRQAGQSLNRRFAVSR